MSQSNQLRLAISAVLAATAGQAVFTPLAGAAEIEEIVITGNRLEETIPQDLAR